MIDGQALVRQTSIKTLTGVDAAALDAAYQAWADTMGEAEVVGMIAFSTGSTLVLVVQHMGGGA